MRRRRRKNKNEEEEEEESSIGFHFLEIERRKQFCNSQTSLQLDSTCMFGAMF